MDSSIHSFSQSISVQYQYRGTGVYQLFIYLSTYPSSTYLVHQLDEISTSQVLLIALHAALQPDTEAIHSLTQHSIWECLQDTRHCSQNWVYSREQNKQNFLPFQRIYVLMREIN